MHRRKHRMYTYQIKEVTYVTNRKKTAIKYGIAAALVFLVFITSFIPTFFINEGRLRQRIAVRFSTDLKYILIWTSNKEKKILKYIPGQNAFVNQKCPKFNCFLSYNKSLLKNDMSNFDAVVFNIRDVVTLNIHLKNVTRSPNQMYILHSLEPASKVPICHSTFDHFFNWTWTYKLNSDIPHPFFNVHNTKHEIVGPKQNMTWTEKMIHDRSLTNIIYKKTKAIAWIVTHCKMEIKYKEFINDFKKELAGYNYTLDVYGACGHKSCPGKERFKCYKMLQKDYFFSLITEETLSTDWVTEKIINSMNHVTIPVVIGGANYSNYLPPGSYIDARARSMKDLGAILDYLIIHPDTYSLLFDWKNHFYFTARSRNYLCDLCNKLNQNKTSKTYDNIRRWWNPGYKKRCKANSNNKKDRFYNSNPDYETVH